MIKEKLLETVKNWEVGGAEFAEFIQYYIKSEEYLHKQCEDENCTDKNRSVIVKLEFWLEDEGLSYFMRTMEQMFGKIEGAAGDFTRTGMEEYSFIGNLEKGSLFFACLAS